MDFAGKHAIMAPGWQGDGRLENTALWIAIGAALLALAFVIVRGRRRQRARTNSDGGGGYLGADAGSSARKDSDGAPDDSGASGG